MSSSSLQRYNFISRLKKHTSAIGTGVSGAFAILIQSFYDTIIKALNESVSKVIEEYTKKIAEIHGGYIIAALFFICSVYLFSRPRRSNEAPPPYSTTQPQSYIKDSHIINVPNLDNQYYIPRDEHLSALDKGFNIDNYRIQALVGLPGVGKTQIVFQYLIRFKDNYSKIFWVNAASYESLVADITKIAIELGLPERTEANQLKIVEAVKRFLSANKKDSNSKWLMVLDNSDDLEMVNKFRMEHLPADAGHILITTQDRSVRSLTPSFIEIEEFSPEIGAEFIIKKSSSTNSTVIIDDARKLSIMLGGLPLALDQAATYILDEQISIAEYIEEFNTESKKLLATRGKLPSDAHKSVSVTFSLAFKKLSRNNPAAPDVIRVCAFLEPNNIPEEIFYKGGSYLGKAIKKAVSKNGKLNAVFKEAARFSLLQRDLDNKNVSTHCLVQVVMQDTISSSEKREWAERIVKAISESLPILDHTNWSQYERLAIHKNKILDIINYNKNKLEIRESATVLNLIGRYLTDRGSYSGNELLLKRAIEIYNKVLGWDHSDTGPSLSNLAYLYRVQGDYKQAEPLYKRALEIYEKALGNKHPDTATAVNDLARLYEAQGRYNHAEPLYKRAFKIRAETLGVKHPTTAISLGNLAYLYRKQGQYEQAEYMAKGALEIQEKALGIQHPQTANSMSTLAKIYQSQGYDEQAEPLFKCALEIYVSALGLEHPYTGISLNNIAGLYKSQGHYDQAEPLYKRALEIYEKTLGLEHPSFASSLNDLAGLYQLRGCYDQAEPLYKRALDIYEKVLGGEHPDTANSLNNLAALNGAQGRYAEAEPLYKRALEIYEKVLGEGHPNTIIVAENYKILLELLNKRGEI